MNHSCGTAWDLNRYSPETKPMIGKVIKKSLPFRKKVKQTQIAQQFVDDITNISFH